MVEQTLVLIKPDAMVRGLAGLVLSRLNETGLEMLAAKVVQVSEALAKEHYHHLSDKPFYQELTDFLQGKLHGDTSVLALVYSGENAVAAVRALAGATHPEEAEPTSIRGAYGRIRTTGLFENVIHASSDTSESEREIKLWFGPDEIIQDIYPTEEVTSEPVPQRRWLVTQTTE